MIQCLIALYFFGACLWFALFRFPPGKRLRDGIKERNQQITERFGKEPWLKTLVFDLTFPCSGCLS
jgi:hypothetical protein